MRDQIAFFAFHSFFVKVETKANLRASCPFGGSREVTREQHAKGDASASLINRELASRLNESVRSMRNHEQPEN